MLSLQISAQSMKNFFEELEELLIMSDVGVQVASNLTEELRL